MNTDVSYLQDADQPFRLIPVQASTGAHEVDLLGLALLALCAVLAGGGGAGRILERALSRRLQGERVAPVSEHKAHWIEGLFALGLLAVFIGLFFWGANVYVDLYRAPPDAMRIDVVGKQWMWKIQHPNGAREINTLHVPSNRTIALDITSQDVIHSFYLPAFRTKHDAVPGMTSTLWFKATVPGEYRMFCAEYCGTDHSRMRGRVVVMPPGEYASWLERQGSELAPETVGRELFRTYGCSGCHRGKSSVNAPSLAGIHGRAVGLADSFTVVPTPIRDSMLKPKNGCGRFRPIMPSFAGRIPSPSYSGSAYIKSLEPGDWATDSEEAIPR